MASRPEWQINLAKLPGSPNDIPAFFFAHGSPALVRAPDEALRHPMTTHPAAFLKDFGPALLEKYKPKGIVVFSAHWETEKTRLVTDYGDENPLLMDYYGFPEDLYRLIFKSRGDSQLSHRIVNLFQEAGHSAHTTSITESRGLDGRGFDGPGLDHGVFIPFRLMFGEQFTDLPIVQVSIDSSLDPLKNWSIGAAVSRLRNEGILILSGGLTIHNLRDRNCFNPATCKPIYQQFDQAVLEAVRVSDVRKRKQAMLDLTNHPSFDASHPRADHFIPLYVAAGAGAGAGGEGYAEVIASLHGNQTFAFGV